MIFCARVHRARERDVGDLLSPGEDPRRRFIVSALMPYLFILFLGTGLLIVTIVSGALKRLGSQNILLFGDVVSPRVHIHRAGRASPARS